MKFGIKLLSYNNQIFDAWVYGDNDNDILLFDTLDQANEVSLNYSKKNPKGQYIVYLYEE